MAQGELDFWALTYPVTGWANAAIRNTRTFFRYDGLGVSSNEGRQILWIESWAEEAVILTAASQQK